MHPFFVRSAFAATIVAATAWALLSAPAAPAVTCPNPVPVVHENNCRGAGTSDWLFQNYDEGIAGYATKTSFNVGESVPLKIARDTQTPGGTAVDIDVHRMGYYGGSGGRLVHSAADVPVGNNFTCNPADLATGELSCSNWSVTYTIPAQSVATSGVYVAKLTAPGSPPIDNHVVFVIRDDDRQPESEILFVLPTADYQAYNSWGGKSLYFDRLGGSQTVSGTGRAVAVSFDRPLFENNVDRNRLFGPDRELLFWLEKQGYDVSYTDDMAAHQDGAELRQHDVVVIPGHSEYWSGEQFHAFEAARDAGTSIASFSANTAYWKVRYEDGGRTLVCFKTVQGDGSGGSGSVTPNDWGPDGVSGTADDALGLDGIAGTADDQPENSTTTFRDNGAPPGDPNAPPGGRVGPDSPESSLFGVMYVADNEIQSFPLSIPPGDAAEQYAADRIWRNTGISENITTNIGAELVGWEWDAVPTQAQYLAHQPAGVKRLAATDVDALGGAENTWLIDEGRQRSSFPPPGQPGTAETAKYTAPSGALVFASGTMRWARGLDLEADSRVEQATYNILSDMGVQPFTPTGLTLDPAGSNAVPKASFTLAPNPVGYGTAVNFDASASTDPDGTIVEYEWDLNGDGSYELSTGTSPTAARSYTSDATIDVRLRVSDQEGATDVTVRTLEVIGNQFPVASLVVTPNPAIQGTQVSFDASASTDPDGTIVEYEWDLNGDGAFELNTGSTSTTSASFPNVGTVPVAVRVIDNGGKAATKTVPVSISIAGVSSYPDAVLGTQGLIHYWRMGEPNGPTFLDSVGDADAAALGEPTFGVTGGVAADPDRAARFDGLDDAARASVDLSAMSTITVEFWLYLDAYTNDDALTLELTDNFNQTRGGFLIDPNAPQQGGRFGVGIGDASSRNNAFFARPGAGQWHHYAFVLDTTAPAAQQITPYVDGQPVTYTKTESGTGAGPFANAVLNFMSRGGKSLFGRRVLDEVAIYDRALSPAEVAEHEASFGTNRRPLASFHANPSPTMPGTLVSFDASSSEDPDGTIVKYEWDLDGDGTYELNTGSTSSASRSFPSEGHFTVGLRVSDNQTGTDTTSRTVKVGPQPPTAAIAANPNPTVVGIPVHLDGSSSSDSDGTIVKYEWDLDGDGSYETETGSGAVDRAYEDAGMLDIGIRVTDNSGMTAATTLPLTVTNGGVGNYGEAVLDTPGLLAYWRMGEEGGPTLADSKGVAHGTASPGATFGVTGGPAEDPNTAVRFDGDDAASAALDLSGTSKATVELWLNWDSYAGDDLLALELTENLNQNAGGFIVDPNAPQQGGSFGVGIGDASSRNNAFFARPSAGQWHHYAFVLDTTAPEAQQITPYVDGQPVTYTKTESGTGAGAFANSTLYMMSRAGGSLFGRGALDEVAVYNRTLAPAEIAQHYASHGINQRPDASLAVSPNPVPVGAQVEFDASSSSDPDGTVERYQWDLDGNGSFETDTGAVPTVTSTYAQEAQVPVSLRVYDDNLAIGTATETLIVGDPPPPPPPPISYSETVLATPGLIHYWRFEEGLGATSLADGVGGATASLGGGGTLGLTGPLGGGAGGFDGLNDFAQASVDLSKASQLTAEFWLSWNSFADDDALAMELTSNFNANDGGLLIDPNASSGAFGVGIGNPETRNNAYFARPSAGQWHHYAFVLDTTAPAAEQITPYVDGQPASYTKGASGTGSGSFADAPLFFMSRSGGALFGAGALDEVAIYNRALSPAEIVEHFAAETD